MILVRAFLLLLASSLLSGCIAAVLPIAAAGLIGKSELDRRREAGLISNGEITETSSSHAANREMQAAASGGPADSVEAIGLPENRHGNAMPETGKLGALAELGVVEGGPALRGGYGNLARFALAANRALKAGQSVTSAVLIPRVSLVRPETVSCEDKSPAVMIDLDAGSKQDGAAEQARDVGAAATLDSGAILDGEALVNALAVLREADIAVIWLSSRDASEAIEIQSALRQRGVLPPGAEDYLSLGRGGDDRKQLRRWETAELFCILAVAGDARGDFDELYDYLLKPEYAVALEDKFGSGWFTTPLPMRVQPGGQASGDAAPQRRPSPRTYDALIAEIAPKSASRTANTQAATTQKSEPQKED